MRILFRGAVGAEPAHWPYTRASKPFWTVLRIRSRSLHLRHARSQSQDPREYTGKPHHPPQKTYKFGQKSSSSGLVTPVEHDTDPNSKIRRALDALKDRLHDDPILKRLDLDPRLLLKHYSRFERALDRRILGRNSDYALLHQHLEGLAGNGDLQALELELKYAFYGYAASTKFSKRAREDRDRQLELAHPAEWFPMTRELRREIHVHVGPTNSGKTYHALKRLQAAKTGAYAGPLRLLAHEVYERLNAQGKACALVTGDERKGAWTDAGMVSCTVEMMPLSAPFDVAVIDEIQMLGDASRGWAWTQAFLGVRAQELHVCGEARTVPLLLELAAACGDKVHIHNYERLAPLEMMPRSLQGNFRELRRGDCVVALNVVVLHSLRRSIEKATNKQCAIIYGALPPETRAQQAKLFNDPDNDYDFLVASNAIGMGLNLSIKRVIFQSAGRQVRGQFIPLSVADVKQISGRAGRFSTAAEDNKREKPATSALDQTKKVGGLVTTLEPYDFPLVRRAMSSEPEPIASAGILPPRFVFERFARYFPRDTPFTYLIMQLKEHCKTNPRLHMCLFNSHIAIADAIESVRGLRGPDRLTLCMAPIETKREGEAELALTYARMVAESRGATVVDVDELDLELLDARQEPTKDYLQSLERLHRGLVIFLWLSYKFTGIFLDRELAEHVKGLVESKIERTLESMASDYSKIRRIRKSDALDAFQDPVGSKPVAQDDEAGQTTAFTAGVETMTHRESETVAAA